MSRRRPGCVIHRAHNPIHPQLFGVGSIPWSPLGRGLLTRPVGAETTRGKSDRMLSRHENDIVPAIRQRCVALLPLPPCSKSSSRPNVMIIACVRASGSVEELAKKKGVSMAQISMAWVLAKPYVSAPIVGTTSLANLEDILGSLQVKLTEEDIKFLEENYKPLPVSGHV